MEFCGNTTGIEELMIEGLLQMSALELCLYFVRHL